MPRRPPLLPSFVGIFALFAAAAECPTTVRAQWAPDGVPLCTAPNLQFVNAIVSDFQGGAIATWDDYRSGGTFKVYAQRVNATGTALWNPDGVPLCTGPADQEYPLMVPDIAGGAIVVWRESTDRFGVYGQRVDAQGASVWAPDGVAIDIGYRDEVSAILPDGSAGVIDPVGYYVAWYQDRASQPVVAVQHVDVNGVVLWSSPRVLAAGTTDKFGAVMASDGIGSHFGPRGAVVAWTDQPSGGGNPDLWAQRVNSAGVIQWGAALHIGTLKFGPAIANVGGDKVVLVWTDARNGPGQYDIYMQKLDGAGNALWSSGGLPVCTAAGNQSGVQVLPDGAGGAFIAWIDSRSHPIYAQHVDGNGTPLWQQDGIPLSSSEGALPLSPKMTADGAGGFIACWTVTGNDAGDIYAQRVDASGNLLWGSGGAPLCRATGYQHQPVTCQGAHNDVIVAWRDERSGTLDVYANTFGAGATGVAQPGVGAPTHLTLLSGNPTRGEARFGFALPAERSVTLDVLDVAGRRVRSIVDGRLAAGTYAVTWDGADESGVKVGAGVYFVRLAGGDRSEASRVVVMR